MGATPIIVGRTADGFLIGTNFLASDGDKLCKVHYADEKVLILAGQPVRFGYHLPSSRKMTWLFDIEKQLATISLALAPEQILTSARKIIVKDVTKYSNYILEMPESNVEFIAVLISVEGPKQPQLWIQDTKYSKSNDGLTLVPGQPVLIGLQPGDLIEIVNRQGPIRKSFSLITTNIIESELQGATQRHIESSDPSYRPPYIMLGLSPAGVHILTKDKDSELCTGSNPKY